MRHAIIDPEGSITATPQDWADHSGQTQTLALLDEHTVDRMDLWQAARWGKVQRIDTICQVDPTAVDAVTDIWHMRRVTALRIAVIAGHPHAVRALIRHGADPNHLAGDGTSPQQVSRNHPPEVQQALRR